MRFHDIVPPPRTTHIPLKCYAAAPQPAPGLGTGPGGGLGLGEAAISFVEPPVRVQYSKPGRVAILRSGPPLAWLPPVGGSLGAWRVKLLMVLLIALRVCGPHRRPTGQAEPQAGSDLVV